MTAIKQKNPLTSKILTDDVYNTIVSETDKSLNLSNKEKEVLLENPVPRFIAEIPYLTGQPVPETAAALNLITYITGSRNRQFFAQRDGQNIRERIDTYIRGHKADREAMELCIDILEEVSLYDHKNDYEEDLVNNHPNPLIKGEINFESEKRRLCLKRVNYSENTRKLIEKRYEGDVLSVWWFG